MVFVSGMSLLSSLTFLKPTRVKPLLAALLYGRLLALPTKIRVGWKGLPGTNTLAYYEQS
jgi:hypothetical protein